MSIAIDLDDYDRIRDSSTGYMYGLDHFEDGPCAMGYDPQYHARVLGIPVIERGRLPRPDMVACWSPKHRAIFVLHGVHSAVARCAIAHEIVHAEHNDVGTTQAQEDRADRISARRLIRPSSVDELYWQTEDPARIALELDVTEHVMRTWMHSRR